MPLGWMASEIGEPRPPVAPACARSLASHRSTTYQSSFPVAASGPEGRAQSLTGQNQSLPTGPNPGTSVSPAIEPTLGRFGKRSPVSPPDSRTKGLPALSHKEPLHCKSHQAPASATGQSTLRASGRLRRVCERSRCVVDRYLKAMREGFGLAKENDRADGTEFAD